MEKQLLDWLLVPSGVSVMVAYHIWLLLRVLKHPNKTVIGLNAINRRFWVRSMMEDVSKNGVLAVQTLRNNIMASTLLASTAIMLSSLIAVLMTGGSSIGGGGGGGGGGRGSDSLVYGAKSQLAISLKFFCILVCFLVAFLFNVQSIRYYSHASILINVPYKVSVSPEHHHMTADYVATTVNRGSYFWSLGLRAFYFSFPLFMWIFGPIPVFLSCVLLVFMLYFLDVTFEFRCLGSAVGQRDGKDEEQGSGN